jgi:transposase
MVENSMLQNLQGRVIGLDSHPDSFTAALLQGKTPAAAILQKVFNKVPIGQLASWAQKNLNPQDVVVLEASGNSFWVARRLQSLNCQVQVLESCHLGRLKEAHANNDRISAVRIGKAYLAGTAKVVWIPDLKTQERRDILHAYRKAVKRHTQMINRIDSYLSDNGVRLDVSLKQIKEEDALARVHQAKKWSPTQQAILESFMAEVQAASQVRQRWAQVMAMEVINDPVLLSLTRLSGIRDVTAFAIGAVIGDIGRFKRPKSMVNYLGLHPRFDDSGNEEWSGGVGGYGRKDLRCLLIESAQCILGTETPLAKWGRMLMAKKSSRNLAVAAVARKLAVQLWYLLKGQWEEVTEIDRSMSIKVGKIISKVGVEKLKVMGKNRKELRREMEQTLKTGRIYHLKPASQFKPKPTPDRTFSKASQLEEYGLREGGE